LTPPRTEEALRYYSIALSLHPTRPQTHKWVADILESKGAFEEAEVEYSKALELDPKYTQARRDLYNVLLAQGKLEKVIAECRKAIELDPKDAGAYIDLGNALEDQGDLPGTVAAYQKAIALKPDLAKNLQLDVFPARYYICRSQWDKAAAEYAKADLWKRPPNDDAFAHACLFLIRGDSKGYTRFCQGMIQRAAQTENPWEAYALARSCAMARKSPVDPARAVQWAEQAVANDHAPWCFHVLGLAQYRAGRFDQALQNFTKANVKAWRYSELNWFPLALVHHRLDHSDEARQCLEEGIRWLERKGPPSPQRSARLLPQDWLEAQLLRREAEELLKIKRCP
jgi:tetratricopeptide (TPR) repeat protein